MKAAIRKNYCSPTQIKIKQVEKPIPKDNDILVKVHHTTVNRTDCANLTAKPFIMRFVLGLFKPKKEIIGTDFAGEVVGIGKDIKSLSIGDKVFGFNDAVAESHAEFLVCTADMVFSIPENIDLDLVLITNILLRLVKQNIWYLTLENMTIVEVSYLVIRFPQTCWITHMIWVLVHQLSVTTTLVLQHF